jgi:hypothetical protein
MNSNMTQRDDALRRKDDKIREVSLLFLCFLIFIIYLTRFILFAL